MENDKKIWKKMYILWLGLLLAALLMFYNNQPIFKDYAEKSTAYTVREASQEGVQYACFEIVNAKIGESCSLAAEDFSLAECIKYFQAEIIFTETAGSVTNYYLYSPVIRRTKTLRGEKINLHVAFDNGRVVMGSPLIYGGY